jgi:hypothetical protein
MIVGAKNWNDRQTWYRQRNDVLEEIRRKLGDAHVLQSCGSNAAGSCMEAVGWDITTQTKGGYSIPADDLLTEYMNNVRNYDKFRTLGVEPTLEPNNRRAILYPLAVRELWGVKAIHITPFSWGEMMSHLLAGQSLQVCISPPGHYLAVVAYDRDGDEYIYNDSWEDRKPEWNGDGFNRRLTEMELRSIVSEAVAYYPPT